MPTERAVLSNLLMAVLDIVTTVVSVGGSFLISWFEAKKRTQTSNTTLYINETVRNVTFVESVTKTLPGEATNDTFDWKAMAIGSVVAAAMLFIMILGTTCLCCIFRRKSRPGLR